MIKSTTLLGRALFSSIFQIISIYLIIITKISIDFLYFMIYISPIKLVRKTNLTMETVSLTDKM